MLCTAVLEQLQVALQASAGACIWRSHASPSLRMMALTGEVKLDLIQRVAREAMQLPLDIPTFLEGWVVLPFGLDLPDDPCLILILLQEPEHDQIGVRIEHMLQLLRELIDVLKIVLMNCLLVDRARAVRQGDAVTAAPVGWFEHEVLATISHELRTPLAAIKGFTMTLLRQDRKITRAERVDFLKEINRACDRQEQLIHRLLRVSHLALDGDPRDRTLVPLVELANEAMETTRQQAQLHGPSHYTFIFDQPATPLHPNLIHADQIREVLEHLLENAMKYSPQGGPIRLTIRVDLSADAMGCHLAGVPGQPGRATEVLVTDQGRGIPSDQLEAIFLPFHRADMRLTRDIGGLGIGLAYCRRIVESFGGTLWAESVEGLGTTLHLVLPLPQVGSSL